MSDAQSDKVKDRFLPITFEKSEVSFKGFRKVSTVTYREDESQIVARREIVETRHAVAVVVFDPHIEQLVMIRQFRLGAQMGTGRGMSAEIVAGLIDDGEEPLEAAHRELKEETGLIATRMEFQCQFLTTPGLTDEVIHLFYAETDASNLASRAGEGSESEQTFPFTLTFDEAIEAVDNNAVYNGIVMIGLMWFARHRQRLTGNAT